MKNVNETYVAYAMIAMLILFAALTSCASRRDTVCKPNYDALKPFQATEQSK